MSKGIFIKWNVIHTSCLPVSHERHVIFPFFFAGDSCKLRPLPFFMFFILF